MIATAANYDTPGECHKANFTLARQPSRTHRGKNDTVQDKNLYMSLKWLFSFSFPPLCLLCSIAVMQNTNINDSEWVKRSSKRHFRLRPRNLQTVAVHESNVLDETPGFFFSKRAFEGLKKNIKLRNICVDSKRAAAHLSGCSEVNCLNLDRKTWQKKNRHGDNLGSVSTRGHW